MIISKLSYRFKNAGDVEGESGDRFCSTSSVPLDWPELNEAIKFLVEFKVTVDEEIKISILILVLLTWLCHW